jgi:hypothetical protein
VFWATGAIRAWHAKKMVKAHELISHCRVDFYQESVLMKIDESKSATTQADCEGNRQNRREFFNGLGKWSMIVVAAVSFLRGSITRAQAGHEEAPRPEPAPQRPAWTVPDDRNERVRVARKYTKEYHKATYPHGNSPHTDTWSRPK